MMYKLFTQVQYDDNNTHRHLVNAVYTNDKQHPRLATCEGVYDMDNNCKWWQCSTDVLLLDDREYKYFTLCQDMFEKPIKRNIIFNKQGEVVLLWDDETHYSMEFVYGSIENYLKTQQTTLGL